MENIERTDLTQDDTLYYNMKKTTLIILFTIMTLSGFAQEDWFGFERYRADNEHIIASGEFPEVVFMGNSITEYWALYHPEFFKQHNYCGRGIGVIECLYVLDFFKTLWNKGL